MTGADLFFLIKLFGPRALELAEKLVEIWSKDLTPDEVKALCAPARKSYDEYLAEAKARLAAVNKPT